ncbi:MAG: hypothetical protein EXR36_10805 [Betaproteobacteria bacterium]|nr:hypothetical protein [Betaproteobacteria bacterium]
MKKSYLVLGLLALVIAATMGYVRWDRQQTKKMQDAVLERVGNATAALSVGLKPEAGPAAQSQVLNDAAQSADADLAAVRSMPAGRILLLGGAAAEYLDTTRELLKRRAKILLLGNVVGHGIHQFRDHMLNKRGASNWTSEAVRLKNALEENFRDYQRTIEAHTKLSGGMAGAYKRFDGLAPAGRLVSLTGIAVVRDQAIAMEKEMAANMEALRYMLAPR